MPSLLASGFSVPDTPGEKSLTNSLSGKLRNGWKQSHWMSPRTEKKHKMYSQNVMTNRDPIHSQLSLTDCFRRTDG